jgi:hypothetical protein
LCNFSGGAIKPGQCFPVVFFIGWNYFSVGFPLEGANGKSFFLWLRPIKIAGCKAEWKYSIYGL